MVEKGNPGSSWTDNPSKRVILDSGAYEIKCSLASDTKPHLVHNAVGKSRKTGKVYVANKLKDELDKGAQNIQVTHPMIRGLLQDSDLQSIIWRQEFAKLGKKFDEK